MGVEVNWRFSHFEVTRYTFLVPTPSPTTTFHRQFKQEEPKLLKLNQIQETIRKIAKCSADKLSLDVNSNDVYIRKSG